MKFKLVAIAAAAALGAVLTGCASTQPAATPAAGRPGSGRQRGYFFNSMVTSTSGQRRATGWMDGRAMILVNSLLSVAIDSR